MNDRPDDWGKALEWFMTSIDADALYRWGLGIKPRNFNCTSRVVVARHAPRKHKPMKPAYCE